MAVRAQQLIPLPATSERRLWLARLAGPGLERHTHLLLAPVADDGQLGRVAGALAGEPASQPAHVLDRAPVDGHEDVAATRDALVLALAPAQAGLRGRAVRHDARDQDALLHREALVAGDRRVERLAGDPEPDRFESRAGFELGQQALRRVDRDREANADRAANRALDHAGDADDLAVGVQQRAAGVARVYRGIRLEQPLACPA